jgi:hypothetical protein
MKTLQSYKINLNFASKIRRNFKNSSFSKLGKEKKESIVPNQF